MFKNRFLLFTAVFFAAAVSLPYIWGMMMSAPGWHFTGFTRNIDDMAVYMSWVTQNASGGPVTYNLFQPDRGGLQFNVYTIALGLLARALARVCSVPSAAALHAARAVQAFFLPFAFYSFSGFFLKKESFRKWALLVFLFGSGFGFLCPASVDRWQPEAITFMSAYLNPLFTVSLILMLLCLKNVFSGKPFFGAVFLLLLGNIHTYDVVIVAALWGGYAVRELVRSKDLRAFGANLAWGLFGSLSTLFNLYLYLRDPIYKSRVDTVISSPEPWYVLTGFGLPLLLAFASLYMYRKGTLDIRKIWIAVFWLVAGLAVIYIPFSQQRKFIMGYMIPVALLAGPAAAILFSRAKNAKRIAAAAFVALIAVTNIANMGQDMSLLLSNQTAARFCPYISGEDTEIMEWVKKNTSLCCDVITAPPQLALLIPGYTGRRVYYGHWSETPEYNKKLKEYMEMCRGGRLAGSVAILPADAENAPAHTIYKTQSYKIVLPE
ncbi:MAG: hypothetical protein ILO36_07120 [Abditibacteriota bacterium]|nr:hypothetical protein [Abditibacteriota bacterium]